MKTKTMLGAVLIFVMGMGVGHASQGATNEVSLMLQKGLLEEEANHNLEAAIQAYQSVVTQTEKDRQFAATAVFRLGECYRKLGRTNEATVQYQRIVRDFPDQTELVKMSQGYVGNVASTESTVQSKLDQKREGEEEAAEIERLKALIKESPDLLNARSGDGSTPLYRAAASGKLRVAKFLLDNHADIDAKNNNGYTPLLIAAERGSKEMVDLLLERGADANASGTSTQGVSVERNSIGIVTPLQIAAFLGYRGIAESLINKGTKVNAMTGGGYAALHLASYKGFKSVAELLLARGADVNIRGGDGITPLMAAALGGNRSIAEWLIANKADVNGKDKNGWTALHTAVGRGNTEMVKLLLENKADPNAMASTGLGTPLITAASQAATPVARLLLEHGASINDTNSAGTSPLLQAVMQGDPDMVKLLLDNKADPNAGSPDGWSVLHWAVANRSTSMVESIIAHGADPNIRDKSGQSSLHWAASNGKTSMVELLIAHGADVNLKDNNGETPLDIVGRAINSPAVGIPGSPMAYVTPPRVANFPGLGVPGSTTPPLPDSHSISELLREHGAVGEIERSTIRLFRKGMGTPTVVFRRDTKSLNHFSLMDVIYHLYGQMGGMSFPDFSHVSIKHGPEAKTEATASTVIDMLNGTNGLDCTKDRFLEYGDIVEIPEREHSLSEQWRNLPESQGKSLSLCASRNIKVVVKGQSNEIRLGCGNYLTSTMNNNVDVLKVLLSSSDLTRLKVSRMDPVTRKPVEITFNAREARPAAEDLWVRDGDVIEVPDKQ